MLGHIGTRWDTLGHVGTRWDTRAPTCPNVSQRVPSCPNVSQRVPFSVFLGLQLCGFFFSFFATFQKMRFLDPTLRQLILYDSHKECPQTQNRPEEDLTSAIGVRHALLACMLTKRECLQWHGLPCSSCVWISRHSSGRLRGSEVYPTQISFKMSFWRASLLGV